MAQPSLIPPHGGKLINRIVDKNKAAQLTDLAKSLPSVTLSQKQACDLEMIAMGAFSPLTGYMGKDDFTSVCKQMRLASGLPWSIPITLAVDDATKATVSEGKQAGLYHSDGTLLAVMDIEQIYAHDKKLEIPNVFGTDELEHPGAKAVSQEGDTLLAGPLEVITVTPEKEPGEQFTELRLTPEKVRQAFIEKGWSTIAAFQTRNPIHRAHEYLTKCALEMTDGLLIHPLVGQTKPGDIPAQVRMQCYKKIIETYYVSDRTMLSVMPGAMRYAGPREALIHALIRQNYGASHFIVGRDHAGVGGYYGTYDAQKMFDNFAPGEVKITPLKFEHSAWCKSCNSMTSAKTCPHGGEDKIFLSGTKVRELLKQGQRPPKEFSRPEVADILIKWATGS